MLPEKWNFFSESKFEERFRFRQTSPAITKTNRRSPTVRSGFNGFPGFAGDIPCVDMKDMPLMTMDNTAPFETVLVDA